MTRSPLLIVALLAAFVVAPDARGDDVLDPVTVFDVPFTPASLPMACVEAPSAAHVIIVFAHETCSHCRAFEAQLAAMDAELREQGFEVYVVFPDIASCDHPTIARSRPPSMRAARVPESAEGEWGVFATPTSFVVTGGQVVARLVGNVRPAGVREALAAAQQR